MEFSACRDVFMHVFFFFTRQHISKLSRKATSDCDLISPAGNAVSSHKSPCRSWRHAWVVRLVPGYGHKERTWAENLINYVITDESRRVLMCEGLNKGTIKQQGLLTGF